MNFFKEYYRWIHAKYVNWGTLASQICFVLYLCDAMDEHVHIEVIAAQAARTYPNSFLTRIDKKKVPDTYIVAMVLKEAKSSRWRYAKGNCMIMGTPHLGTPCVRKF